MWIEPFETGDPEKVRRVTSALDALHLAVLVENEHRQVEFVNQAFLTLFTIPLNADEFAAIPCDVAALGAKAAFVDEQVFIDGIHECISGQKKVVNQLMQLKDGRWLERHYYPFFSGGEYRGHAWVYNDVSEKVRLVRALKRQANVDALTGLSNRRRIEADLHRQLQISRRYARPVSVLLCDIDFFKNINDTHGHTTGDRVLRIIGQKIMHMKRGADMAGRWGGEEFLVILPETDLAAALAFGERLRRAIAEHPMPIAGLSVTISAGVNQCNPEDEPVDSIAAADYWLYRAKASGRNCIASCLDIMSHSPESAQS